MGGARELIDAVAQMPVRDFKNLQMIVLSQAEICFKRR
jgi:hypothetical protein